MFVLNCFKYLKSIYNKSKTLGDLFEIIYTSSTYAHKNILY